MENTDKLHEALREQIGDLLAQFSKETGLFVQEINIQNTASVFDFFSNADECRMELHVTTTLLSVDD